jgi:thiol:disulfide interchange protein
MPRISNSAFKPLWGLFAILLGVSAITVISKMTRAKEIVPWRTDLSAAREEAKRDAKPLLLYFTASWCGPCQEMKSQTWSDVSVEAKLRNYVPMKIDIDADQPTALQYQINGIPAFVLLDRDGNVAKETSGFMYPDQFLAWLEG